MPLRKDKLLDKIDKLRDRIRNEEFVNNNTEILVCTDEALKEIAKKRPLKTSDFLAISGLEKDFIDKYADIFLKEIKDVINDETKEVKVSKTAYKVLHHYKDRLANISKNNPNLYMGKIEKIRNFDLETLEQNEKILEFLLNNRVKSLKLELKNEDKQKSITTLYRSTNKALKETGSYNLYIAYPYVEGIFRKDQFPIKAPLLYFPVKLERNKREFVIKKDLEKDIIFNRDLLLVTSKIESNNLDIDMPSINSFSNDVLKDVVFPFYEKNDIQISNKERDSIFEPFKNELKNDFVKFRFDQFELRNYITLGRYQPYSSMIQKDMDSILSLNKYNELLEGLIDEKNLYAKEKEGIPTDVDSNLDEDKIIYINDLNDAQERVIDLINNEKKIVIWGPPGTGKSQTITSLIASSVLKKENVLVVSEKKVALDVIYSRLKQASKYVMFVDDVENKQNFYTKLKAFLDPVPPVRTRNNDLYALEEEIKEITNTLDKSLQLLYKDKVDGVSVSSIYKRYLKDREVKEELTPQRVYQMFVDTFKKITFQEINELEKTFDKNKELEEYLIFQDLLNKYPLLLKLDTKISRSGKIELEQFNKEYLKYQKSINKKGFFQRRSLKKAFLKDNSLKLVFLTKKKSLDTAYLKLLLRDSGLHDFLVNNALRVDKFLTKHEKLTKLEKKYLDMLLYHPLVKEYPDLVKERTYLFNAFFTGFIEKFKAKNQIYLYIINDYEKKMSQLNELMEEKRLVSSESFEMELYQHAFNFSNTKRIMDVKRVLDAQQRPSIKAFIDIFEPEMMENIRVWMMTPEVVSAIMPLRYGMFDLVIFDEASQMYVEKGIPAIYRAKKVVIAGDPKQLRPSSLGIGRVNGEDEFYEDETLKDVSLDAKSLLDLARYKYRETLLNYHYRSEFEELIAFSNHAFYDGKLIVSPNQQQSKKPPIEYLYVKDGVFRNRENILEAKEVIETIKKVFRQRKNNETIGVITFNSSQRDLIESMIDDELFKKGTYQKKFEKEVFRNEDGEDKSLFVKNIENVQGDERDIIIFSMGYGKDEYGSVKRRFGWLSHEGGQNRLNVAITRAKKKIYFISSLYPEEFKVDDLANEGPKLLKDFMRYCYFVSNKKIESTKTLLTQLHATEKETKEALLSTLIEEIKDRLEKNGFTVKTSIGIGGYKIDLALYDGDSDSYKLGIICDISNEESCNARKDLLHQEKYLKSRNWKIYRMFAANWYTDPNREMRNIRDELK
ncbi:MAG: AAA domain-containing protein [Acholeplasma sp.]|nr:AAA domain-containing protein [Acholeplasma sp.]